MLRADSGFYLADVATACRNADVRFSITDRMIGTAVKDQIATIADENSTPIDYFLPGAGVAESEFPRSRPDPAANSWPNAARSTPSG